MNAAQLLRMAAEHGPAARAELLTERTMLDLRRSEIVRLLDALDDVMRVAEPMTPNAGRMEDQP